MISEQTLEKAITWFVVLQEQNLDPAKHVKFQRWLQQHEMHQIAYAQAEQLWSSFDRLKTARIPELAEARRIRPRSRRYGLASVLMIAIFNGWWLDYSAEPIRFSTGIGQHHSMVLADGSQIVMNAATQLTVRQSWLRREVQLQHGEMMVTVAHEPFRPFDVYSGALRVRDIGTRFNVRRQGNTADVTVLEGVVEVSSAQTPVGQRLTAGQRRQMNQLDKLLATETVNLEQTSAWLDGRLIFDHTPMSAVAAEIERQHPVQIRFAQTSLAQETITGSFAANDLKTILRTLETILPVQTQRQGKTIVLSKR